MAASGQYTRSQALRLLRRGSVAVDGIVERDPSRKVDPAHATVTLEGEPVEGSLCQYVMLHKPAGLLTAARDARAETVMALVPEALRRRRVLPVGRLDKDTTGLLLLTNDGPLAHQLLSPKRHVLKEYHARVQGHITREDCEAFQQGLALRDFTALPAKLQVLATEGNTTLAAVFLREGKFHQVKRMFAHRGHEVLSLHRVAFGPLRLPQDLPPGAYRSLTSQEVESLRQAAEGLPIGSPQDMD